jgi:putative salt-induced outer membrane protein YdiY
MRRLPLLLLALTTWSGSWGLAAEPGVLPPPGSTLELAPADSQPTDDASVLPTEGPADSAIEPASAGDGALDAALLGDVTPTPMWYHLSYWVGPDPWNAGVELGVNGSQGLNDVLSIRSGGHLKRETKRWKLDSSIVYNKNVANSLETQNNAKLDWRLDRILADSPWTLFNLNNAIYDEFQAYNLQLSINGGVGYQFVKTPVVDLLGRFGAGATREFGGPDNEWTPTALFGVDYTHKITATQRLAVKSDYFPEWGDWSNYRIVTDAGWVIDLDSPKNVSLKLSIIDRYDSTPNGAKPNSFDYAALLIWGL